MSIEHVKPMVMLSPATLKLMVESMHKVRSAEKKTADEMAGAGSDLPKSPPEAMTFDTSAPSSSVPLGQTLVAGEAAEQAPLVKNVTKVEADSTKNDGIPVWPRKPWYYIANHPTDSESD